MYKLCSKTKAKFNQVKFKYKVILKSSDCRLLALTLANFNFNFTWWLN